MNVAHGDQQVIGRDNSGILAQGQAHVEQRAALAVLPAERLRAEFAEHPDAVAAINTLEAELQTDKPRASVVARAIETLKNVANISEIGQTFFGWLADPGVQHHLAIIMTSAFGVQ